MYDSDVVEIITGMDSSFSKGAALYTISKLAIYVASNSLNVSRKISRIWGKMRAIY